LLPSLPCPRPSLSSPPRPLLLFFLPLRLPPRSTLFPYTTLFRSIHDHSCPPRVVVGKERRACDPPDVIVDDPNGDSAGPGLFLGEPDRGDLRLGEDDLRDGVMIGSGGVRRPGHGTPRLRWAPRPSRDAVAAHARLLVCCPQGGDKKPRGLPPPGAKPHPPVAAVTRMLSSTSSHDPGSRPIVSSPRSSVRGSRPAATSTSSEMIVCPF